MWVKAEVVRKSQRMYKETKHTTRRNADEASGPQDINFCLRWFMRSSIARAQQESPILLLFVPPRGEVFIYLSMRERMARNKAVNENSFFSPAVIN